MFLLRHRALVQGGYADIFGPMVIDLIAIYLIAQIDL